MCTEAAGRLRLPATTGIAVAVAVAFTLVFGVLPSPMIRFASQATLL